MKINTILKAASELEQKADINITRRGVLLAGLATALAAGSGCGTTIYRPELLIEPGKLLEFRKKEHEPSHNLSPDHRTIRIYGETIAKLMLIQEEKLGIKHRGKLNVEFKRPNLHAALIDKFNAGYNQNNDTLYLRPELMRCDVTLLKDNPEHYSRIPVDISKYVSSFVSDCNLALIKWTLDHELGHWYPDMLSRYLGNGSWPKPKGKISNKEKNTSEMIVQDILSEGIATYFEMTLNNTSQNEFSDKNWPSNFEFEPGGGLHRMLAYSGGHYLVKPIIDNYGEKGIAHLILNPPVIKNMDFRPLIDYKANILEQLADMYPKGK